MSVKWNENEIANEFDHPKTVIQLSCTSSKKLTHMVKNEYENDFMLMGKPIRGGGGDFSDDGEPVRKIKSRKARYVIDDDDDDDDETASASEKSTLNRKVNSAQKVPKRKRRIIPTRTNIATEIMGDDPMNDIKITSPSPPKNHHKHLSRVTTQDMSTSLRTLSPYLQPQPTKHDISTSTTIDYRKFSIPDEFIQPFMIDVVIKPGVLNLEMMLLVVEAIGRSSAKFMKAMFRPTKKQNPPMLLGGYVVFKKWMCFLFDRLEDQFQNDDHDSKYISSDGSQKIEEMIASRILDLICKFNVIKDLKQIGLLKSKFRVDWFTIVEKSIKFGSAYELSGLLESSKNANNHLNTIKRGSSVGNATTPPSLLEKKVSHTPSSRVDGRPRSQSSTSEKNNDTSYPPSKTNRSKVKNWTPPKCATSTSTSSPSSSLASSNVASVSGKAISSSNDSINHRNPHLKDAKNWIPPQTEPKWIPPNNGSGNAHTTASTAPVASSSQQRMARLLEDAKRKHDPTSQPPPQQQQQGAASNRSSQPQKKNNTDNLKPSSTGGDGGWGEAAPTSTAEKPSASSWGKSTSDKSSGDGNWGGASVNKSPGWDANAKTLPDNNVARNNSSGGWGSSRSGGDAGSSGWNGDKSNINNKKPSSQQQSSTGSNNGQSAWSSNGSKKSDEHMTRNPSSSFATNEHQHQHQQSSASNSHINEFGNNVGVNGSSNIGRKADRTNGVVDNLSEDGEINDPQSRSMHLKRNNDVLPSNNKREFRYRDLEDSAPYPIKKTRYDNSSAPRAVSMSTNSGSSYSRDSNHASSSGGMGRGREATKPAWMSRMESASADGGKVQGTNAPTREETPHNRSQNYSSLGNERSPRGDTSGSANGGGRGRERTQPAWMTKQQANNASSSAVGGGTNNQRESTVARQVSSNEMKGGPMSGGRGRERTMPSWMTKKPNNTAGNGLNNRELDRNTPEKTRQMDMNASTGGARSPGMIRQPPQNADYGSSRQISNTNPSNGTASTGRGRGMTAPAWMTRKSSNNDHDTTMDARRENKSHEGDGEKGAVGRGRGMTEPAWMTRNSSNNTDHGSSAENQRNAATNKPSRQVTDTAPVGPQSIGRGRGATTPAWMTQKRTNVNNVSAESQRNPISGGTNREPRSADNGILDRRHTANVPERSTHQAVSGRPVGTPGIGRGRGATTPAWMTKQGTNSEQGSTDNTRSRSDVVPQRQVNVEESGGRSNANRERERPTPNNDDVRRGNQDFGNTGRNNSMGRGHDQTLPAWMTKDGAKSSPTKSASEGNRRDGQARDNNRDYQSRSDSRTGSASRSYSDQAHNSRHETGRNNHNGYTTQSRDGGQDSGVRGYRDHDSHASNFSPDRGAGRSLGRGKDINRPAWMSKN